MPGGFMMGLGQGLQGFGNAMAQVPLQKHEAQRQAMQMALQQQQVDQTKAYQDAQLAIQQEAQNRLQQQMNQHSAQFTVQNAPANNPYTPEQRQSIEQAGFGSFVRPDMTFAPGQIPVTEGVGPSAQPNVDSGRGYSIPTEDSKYRTAIINNQARQGLEGDRTARMLAIQKMRGEAMMEVERLRQLDPARNAQAAAALQNAAARFQALDLAWQKEMREGQFQAEVTTPNILEDNAAKEFELNNPILTTGGEEIIIDGKRTGTYKPVTRQRVATPEGGSKFIPPSKTVK